MTRFYSDPDPIQSQPVVTRRCENGNDWHLCETCGGVTNIDKHKNPEPIEPDMFAHDLRDCVSHLVGQLQEVQSALNIEDGLPRWVQT